MRTRLLVAAILTTTLVVRHAWTWLAVSIVLAILFSRGGKNRGA